MIASLARIAAILIVSSVPLAADEADSGLGPLQLRASFPLEQSLPSWTPLPPAVAERGEGRAGFRVQMGNVWSIAGDVWERRESGGGEGYAWFLDMEVTRLTAEVGVGLGGGWEMAAEIVGVGWSGGFGDALIEAWHDLAGLPDGGRPDHPRHQYEAQISSEAGEVDMTEVPTRLSFGDTLLSVRKRISPGGKGGSAWMIEAAVELPTGSPALWTGSGGYDFRLGVHGSEGWRGRHFLDWGLGRVFVGDYEMAPVPVGDAWHGHLGYEYLTPGGWSWPLQVLVTDSHYGRGDGDAHEPRALIQGGVRSVVGDRRRWMWEGGFSQNLTLNDNESDFALTAAFSYRWGEGAPGGAPGH